MLYVDTYDANDNLVDRDIAFADLGDGLDRAEIEQEGGADNDDRAAWGEAAIGGFRAACATDPEDTLADMLCDLMHWCDRNNTEFAHELARGLAHYEEETCREGEQGARINITRQKR